VSSFAEEFHRFNDKLRPIIGTCIYALAAGIAAVGFQLAITWLYRHTFSAAANDHGHFLWISLGVIVITSLITGWLLNSFALEAAGSGIPQVKLNFWKEFGHAPRRIALVKFVAGEFSVSEAGKVSGAKGRQCKSAAIFHRPSPVCSVFRNKTVARQARLAPLPVWRQHSTLRWPRSRSC